MRYKKYCCFMMLGFSFVFAFLAIIESFRLRSGWNSIFGGFSTVLLLLFAALLLLAGLIMRKPAFNLRMLGYYLLHGGLLIFMLGCFIWYLNGQSVTVEIPIDGNSTYSQVQSSDGDLLQLGFYIGVSDFTAEQYSLEEDGVSGPKYYEATLILKEGYSDELHYEKLIVNKPVRKAEWKILLMGYDDESGAVSLLLKKDNGEWLSLTGIWFTLIGAFLMCFIKKRKVGDTE